MIGPALSLTNGVSRDNDYPGVEKMESEDIVEEKPKVMREKFLFDSKAANCRRPVAANGTRAERVRGSS